MCTLNKIILALFIYPLFTSAHAGRQFDNERLIDTPSVKPNTRGAVSSSIKPESTIHDAHVSKPYSRQNIDITNELELYKSDFSARVIVESTVSPDDYKTLESAISSTLNANLKAGFRELISFKVTSYTFTPVSRRRMERIGRILTNTVSTGRTVIDVEGEADLFGVTYDRVTKYEFNGKVMETLEDNLGKREPFDSLTFEVSVEKTPSPSVNDSNEPSVTTSNKPTVDESDEPSVNGSDKPSVEVVDSELSLSEETELIGGKGSNNSSGIIIAGVLSVVAVTMGIGMFAKKRYGFTMESFRRKGRHGYVSEGEFIAPTKPRTKKKDTFFDQYVVECCTDNDLIFENTDEHFFTPKLSTAPLSRDLNDTFDTNQSENNQSQSTVSYTVS